MRYSIRTPLLHILHSLPSLPGRLGGCLYDFQFVHFDRLPERGERLGEEIGSCGELFSKNSGLAPVFEGGDGGEEDEDALGWWVRVA